MPRHMDFVAWIQLGSGPLREYGTEKDGNTVSCFIPSFGGTTFSVHWKDEGSQVFTAGYVVVDGAASPGRFLTGSGETFRTGVRSGPNSERPFVFADIPDSAPGPSATSTVGTIELKIMQAKRGEGRPNNDPDMLSSSSSQEKLFASMDAKHRALLGVQERPYLPQYPLTWSAKPLDGGRPRSYVKFIFHYRTYEWLITHGLMALRPNTPPKSIVKRTMVKLPLTTVVRQGTYTNCESEGEGDEGDEYGGDDDEEDDEGEDDDDDDDENSQMYSTPPSTISSSSIKSGKTVRTERAAFSTDPNVEVKPRKAPRQRVPNGLGSRHPSKTDSMQTREAAEVNSEGGKRTVQGLPRELTIAELEAKYKTQLEEAARNSSIQAPPRKLTKKEQKARELSAQIAQGPHPELTIPELKEKYKVQFEEEMARRKAGEASLRKVSKSQSKAQPYPAYMQQHPHASNTYVLPSGSGSGSGSGYPAAYPPFPVPGRTPSGRPSAVIDTRMFGYASPSLSESSTAGSSSSGYPQRPEYPAHRYSYDKTN